MNLKQYLRDRLLGEKKSKLLLELKICEEFAQYLAELERDFK